MRTMHHIIPLALLLVIGCADDETTADPGSGGDTAQADAGMTDDAEADTTTGELADTATVEADTAEADTSPADTNPDDTEVADTAIADTEVMDSGEPDTAEPDTGPPIPTTTPDLPDELVPQGDEFMVVMLPDTQIYALRHPETFESQLKWIAEHAAAYRIVFVSHVGDIVQNGNVQEQWDVARGAYDWLEDIDLPHGLAIGSHDNTHNSRGFDHPFDNSCSPQARLDCNAIDYNDHFGAELYADRDWYGGASPSGLSSYQVIEVQGMQLLFLHVVHDTPEPELEWASEVLDAHPGTLAHLTTHRYLFDYRLTGVLPSPLGLLPAGRFNEATYEFGSQGLVYHAGLTSQELWSQFIRVHPNIWGVHCGHVDAEFWQQAPNAAGLPVYEVLIDYQNMDDGGGGWLRLLTFKPSEDTVEAVTFSTLTGEVRGNGDGFDHSINLLEDYKDRVIDDLEAFGLDREEAEAYLLLLRQEGTEERMRYYNSLYNEGRRDSRFTMDVDFQAYIEASR